QDRERRHGFAGARLADQGVGLTAVEIERNSAHGLYDMTWRGEGDGEILDAQQRHQRAPRTNPLPPGERERRGGACGAHPLTRCCGSAYPRVGEAMRGPDS